MSTIVSSRVKPEDEELAKKKLELAKLESELADRELYIATLRAELAAFERQYLKIVGTRYAELDEIDAQIAEQLARQQSGNTQFQDAAQKARRHAEESRSAAEARSSEDQSRALPSKELKSLYREVAKRVHPDLRAPNKTSSYRAHCNGPTTTPPTRFELWWNFIGFGRSQVIEGESVRGGHLND